MLSISAFLVAATMTASPGGLDPGTRAKLDAGKVVVTTRKVPGLKVPEVVAMGVVDAPPEAVWPHVDRCSEYADFLPKTIRSEELSREGTEVRCIIEVDLPFPLGTLWNESVAQHLALPGRKFVRRWKMTRGTYEVNQGAWELEPWGPDGRKTLLTYRVAADPNIPIPASLGKLFQSKAMPGVIEAVRKRVARAAKGKG